MHSELTIFRQLLEPRQAVEYLRFVAKKTPTSQPFNWGILREICFHHLEGFLINQEQHFEKVRNSTGLATILEERAAELTQSLPERMTATPPLNADEAERAVYLITLLRMAAKMARALHNKDWAMVNF